VGPNRAPGPDRASVPLARSYEIGLSPDGKRWSAVRVDTPNVSLAAGTCMELKELIENDHAERKPPACG
jgi:hypothetical protein